MHTRNKNECLCVVARREMQFSAVKETHEAIASRQAVFSLAIRCRHAVNCRVRTFQTS